jgi:hypothetical protein
VPLDETLASNCHARDLRQARERLPLDMRFIARFEALLKQQRCVPVSDG